MTSQLNEIVPVMISRELDRTEAFWRDRLGFTTRNRYPDYLIMRRDSIHLHFSLCTDCDPLRNTSAAYVYVMGVDALYEAARKAGAVHPNGTLSDKDYGMRDFAVLDVDHNQVIFGEGKS
jgi:catechol 2,3-dioxygenase-like lactoylglutathione lyase family enzyme